MKVKIGNKIFDSEKEPIMIILDEKDKNNISLMKNEDFHYCSYPLNCDSEYIVDWMLS